MADIQYNFDSWKAQMEATFADNTNGDITASDHRQSLRDAAETFVIKASQNILSENNILGEIDHVQVFGATGVDAYGNTNEVQPTVHVYCDDAYAIRIENVDNVDADTKAWVHGQNDSGEYILGRISESGGTDSFHSSFKIDQEDTLSLSDSIIFSRYDDVFGDSERIFLSETGNNIGFSIIQCGNSSPVLDGVTFSSLTANTLNFVRHDSSTTGVVEFSVARTGGTVFGSPTGGNKGAGTINAKGVYDDNTLLTDYVFEIEYTGKSQDQKHKNWIRKSLKEELRFVKENFHLSTMIGRKEWEEKEGSSIGHLVSQIWETSEVQFLYLVEMHERLKKLEANG